MHARGEAQEKRYLIWRRIFEIIPGLASWSILLSVVVLAFVNPIKGMIFVICFYLFWLFRLIYMTTLLVASYTVLNQEQGTHWAERCQDLLEPNGALKKIEEKIVSLSRGVRSLKSSEEKVSARRTLHSEKRYVKQLKRFVASGTQFMDYRSLYQVVIFPNYKEDVGVLNAALEALSRSNYPLDRFIVVMAFEGREGEPAKRRAKQILERFGNKFYHLMATFHPSGLPNERAVKGANATWAARQVKEFLLEKNIPLESVLASCFDADTCVAPEYFGCLTYNFLIRPHRLLCSFQPIPVYHNNIWEAPPFARVMETSSSYWQLIESANPDHLVTFSSHSMSFQSLVQADYWPVDMISDDSAIFWRCYLHYKGKYKAIPLPVTLSMNMVVGANWFDTFRKIYIQKRRWAWGIENFPMVMVGFLREKEIPFFEKVRHGFKMLESHVSWATWGLMLTFFGWLPLLQSGREYGLSVVSFYLPKITEVIFNLAGISLVISIALGFLITPKKPPHVSKLRNFAFLLQWFVPLLLPAMLALPALDAQTRLLMGRYLNFEVTKKV